MSQPLKPVEEMNAEELRAEIARLNQVIQQRNQIIRRGKSHPSDSDAVSEILLQE